ncbi:hypothetical protein PSHT_01384 [Puccinia striiformis]|uniref:Uncharacterized protein n=2 Tax=Puccinia striiformis TaxID=27350 RepID=A0A0L0VRN8_9BASI|nr:hypothetical protein Pst134EB_014237 [Puccinia striiformis f. sp. tritici]KAI9622793.1 hypothetical protein H4Q26_015077 [Puccinia striiformis f. sp. tritici PST-130]KNF01936.1 hypothetical protein PSTG_04761 [Puccinia striiformis f. sp. tritici PST-78]POW22277.1 hypothetical protein PSHT_01384 [Puccinia striiformis]
MRLDQSLRRLTSLAIATSISLKSSISATAFDVAPEAIELTKSDTGLELSPNAKQIFKPNPMDAEAHLKTSRMRYDELHVKIQKSVTEGKLIHVEDGEGDDLWQNILGVRKGMTPNKVFLHGGYWKVREECANIMWDHVVNTFGIEKPEIMTLHGSTHGSLQAFDHAEGGGLIEPSVIKDLQQSSLDLGHEDYVKKVDKAHQSLRETLNNNDFTTIALKTAPAGLVDIIEEFKDKLAIIWTGPVERAPRLSSWETKYNYYQAPEEGDKLLDMKVPIVIVSPWMGNARMNSIVDKEFMPRYRSLLPKDAPYVPTDDSFPGFNNLANIQNPNAKFSNYVFHLADGLRDQITTSAHEKGAVYDKEVEDLLSKNLGREELEKGLEAINMKRSRLHLGHRWITLSQLNTKDKTFREFCPVDHAVQLVTDPGMKDSVKEVIEVEMKRPDKFNNEYAIDVRPKQGSNVYIISQMDSGLLEEEVQSMVGWMADGEKPMDLLQAESTKTHSRELDATSSESDAPVAKRRRLTETVRQNPPEP